MTFWVGNAKQVERLEGAGDRSEASFRGLAPAATGIGYCERRIQARLELDLWILITQSDPQTPAGTFQRGGGLPLFLGASPNEEQEGRQKTGAPF